MTDRLPDAPPDSRLALVSRRAFLQRSAAALGLTAVAGVVAACSSGGSGDAKALGATTTSTAGAVATTTSTTTPTTSTTTAAASGAIPTTAELAISFTYTAQSSFGRVNNPYIAVWIEDANAALTKVVSVWYKSEKPRYLNELQEFASTPGVADAMSTVSGATRTPGDFQVLWDGTDLDGTRVATGAYFVCIEAAREHGPHSLIRQSVTIGDRPATTMLTSDTELSNAAADYRVS